MTARTTIGAISALIATFVIVCIPIPAAAQHARTDVPYRRDEVVQLAEKVADYQLATLAGGYMPPNTSPDTADPKGWVQGAFYVGLAALAERSDRLSYDAAILARGMANEWALGKRIYHADDHCIGAVYLWASRHGAGRAALQPLERQFKTILAYPPQVDLAHAEYDDPRGVSCDRRWCWSDALFMAPPVWLELSLLTGDGKFAEYAKSEFEATTSYLYDDTEHLYFRDSRFFDRRGPDAEKIFWSRGNGWVFAGLARMIPLLPRGDPTRQRMESIFKQMAAKLRSIQKADGYWAPSLLAKRSTPPETSGTGFFVYGLAWGLHSGLLPRKEYESTVLKGWSALVRAVHPNGKLGFVQRVSDRPDDVTFEDTQFYGVGAFLLAAAAISDLDLRGGDSSRL